MKQVVITTPPDQVVTLDNVTDKKYYGFILAGNSPGMIIKENPNDGKYVSIFFEGSTSGNPWGKSNTLKRCIEHLLSHNNKMYPPKVYEFDTYRELFAWALNYNGLIKN